jgi:diacylglycerol kinase
MHSFRFALAGLSYVLRSQRNATIHLCATVLVVGSGFILKINRSDWAWLILAISLVFAAESFNTAIELLADRITSEPDALIGRAKDVSAAAVLTASLGAVGIGLIVFWPYLIATLSHG